MHIIKEQMNYLKDSLEEMQGNSRLKQSRSEIPMRKYPKGSNTSEEGRSVGQKHSSFAGNLNLFASS